MWTYAYSGWGDGSGNQTFDSDVECDIQELRQLFDNDNTPADSIRSMTKSVRIAACQTPEFREDLATSLSYLEKQTNAAERDAVDVLLFPEGYLQGYLTDKSTVNKYALDLNSKEFGQILSRFSKLKPVIVFGLIEKAGPKFFNSAVVIAGGMLITVYRKTHLLPGESVFSAANDYPIFEVEGLDFGINICYDMQFSEAAAALKNAGADVILCPANNMMRKEKAEQWKQRHHEMRAKRAKETGLWIVSADVAGEKDGRIGYGPTSVIGPKGEVLDQVPLLTEGIVTVDIPVKLDK